MPRLSLLFLGMAAILAGALFAGDVSLELNDGSTVMLYENRTWELRGGNNGYAPRSDIRVDMEDGRILVLRPNGTWGYADEEPASAKPPRPNIRRLQAIGIAKKQNPQEAMKSAREEAVRRLIQNFQKTIKDPSISDSLAASCVRKSLVPGLDFEERTDESGGAHVTATLTEDRIQDVLDCVGR